MNKNDIIENLIKEVGSMLYRMIYPIRCTLYANINQFQYKGGKIC